MATCSGCRLEGEKLKKSSNAVIRSESIHAYIYQFGLNTAVLVCCFHSSLQILSLIRIRCTLSKNKEGVDGIFITLLVPVAVKVQLCLAQETIIRVFVLRCKHVFRFLRVSGLHIAVHHITNVLVSWSCDRLVWQYNLQHIWGQFGMPLASAVTAILVSDRSKLISSGVTSEVQT